jgi:pantothenate synthetase
VSLSDAETLEETVTLSPGDRVLLSLAVRFGTTRLIDNIPVTVPHGQ